jgi:hypothetical protein
VGDELGTDGEFARCVLQQVARVRQVGEVLNERSAEEHVGQLHPAAHREHRQAELDGGEEQRRLEMILLGRHAVHLR